jgi:hypothetical protein
MRHDLYQLFNVRGWELTREGGVFSYITSDTFYTIGSKQTTRKLLQNNELHLVLDANSNTFDATVSPAIFSLTKSTPNENFDSLYIDASETEIDQYRSLISDLSHASQNLDSDVSAVNLELQPPTKAYAVQLKLYRETLRNAFFEPTEANLKIHEKHMQRIRDLAEEWEEAIRDSTTLENNLDRIEESHISEIQPGAVSIVGLLTLGGQGLATGNNEEYLAYMDGSRGAKKVRERNSGSFTLGEKNENAFSSISRVITEEHIADIDSITDQEKIEGIDEEKQNTWVPIEKGFKSDEIYFKAKDSYIDWSKASVEGIDEDGLIRNPEYYFEPGVFSSRGGFSELKVRYTNNSVIDSTGVVLIPIDEEVVSAKYLIGLLNSELCEHITDTFINSSGKQATDMRHIPVPIPNKKQENNIIELVDRAIEIRKGESSESLSDIQKEIDEQVESLYKINL